MSKKLISKLLLITLSLVLAACTTALGQQRRNFQSQAESEKQAEANRARAQQAKSQADAATVFSSARDLITDGQWAKAQEKFNDYLSSYPNEKNLDAALYWMAYAQQKLAKYDECRTTILRLIEKYPASSWRNDARLLLAQVPGAYVRSEEHTSELQSHSFISYAVFCLVKTSRNSMKFCCRRGGESLGGVGWGWGL